jgi:aminopeptidase
METYLCALDYDPEYYRTLGPWLKQKIDNAKTISVNSSGGSLVYQGPFEDAKLNIGDYREMKNAGGMFPIGEVFTEPKDIAQVSGRASIFAFGDKEFKVNLPVKPITLVIEQGKIIEVLDATPEFDAVMEEINEGGEAVIRELGFGLNRAFTKTRTVADVGSYERMCGIHLSLGGKHAVYTKEGFSRKHSRFHVDVFVDVTSVDIDREVIYQDGKYHEIL